VGKGALLRAVPTATVKDGGRGAAVRAERVAHWTAPSPALRDVRV